MFCSKASRSSTKAGVVSSRKPPGFPISLALGPAGWCISSTDPTLTMSTLLPISVMVRNVAGTSLVGSKRELVRWRITVLISSDFAVVFFCCFVQFEMAIARRRSESLTQRMHFLRGQRLEAACNFHVLL